jgi:hypothetical protein
MVEIAINQFPFRQASRVSEDVGVGPTKNHLLFPAVNPLFQPMKTLQNARAYD